MRIAAIDQGTTSTRVLVADTDGHADIMHSVRHRQYHPQPGWVEHSPAALLADIRACIEAARSDPRGIDAIALDNQGESCLAWDAETGEALSPIIVWQDNRTASLVEEMRLSGAAELTLARAGLPLDAYFSASKFTWLLRHNDRVRDAYRAGTLRLGTTDAYFLDKLTGRFVTDTSTASRTSLMNLASGQWDEDLCRLFGVPMGCLPTIQPTVGDFGCVGNIPIMASIVDQQAALYGHGCRQAGDAKITFGTGAFALALTGDQIIRQADKGLLPTVAWKIGNDVTYAVDGGVYDASSAVEWAGRLGLFSDLSEINAFDLPPAIARGVAFVPALSGLACPHWDRTAGAMWIGMDASTTRRDMCQALLEGIALCTADVLSTMDASVKIGTHLSVDGGLARNGYFTQFLADVLERTIQTYRFDELTAFGCAALAARGMEKALPMPKKTASIVEPCHDTRTIKLWRDRFSDAVGRAKGWR